jgi:hypothetical protein
MVKLAHRLVLFGVMAGGLLLPVPLASSPPQNTVHVVVMRFELRLTDHALKTCHDEDLKGIRVDSCAAAQVLLTKLTAHVLKEIEKNESVDLQIEGDMDHDFATGEALVLKDWRAAHSHASPPWVVQAIVQYAGGNSYYCTLQARPIGGANRFAVTEGHDPQESRDSLEAFIDKDYLNIAVAMGNLCKLACKKSNLEHALHGN